MAPRNRRSEPDITPQGVDELVEACPHMRRVLEHAGAPPPRRREAGFESLIRIIVDQQVSTAAGAAIWRRLEEGLGTVAPETVLATGEEPLRAFGLSKPKARYTYGIAQAVTDGTLDLAGLDAKDDDAARAHLVAIKGIGRWTADIYLMFALGRPDILPAGDLALQASAHHLMNLRKRPDEKRLEKIARRWRPWRSTASLMLWQYYRLVRTGGTAPLQG